MEYQPPEMSFEQFLRGSLNAQSQQAPKSLRGAVQDPNLPHGIKRLYGGTLKHRIDCLNAATNGVMSGNAEESFSIRPISVEQEGQLAGYTRQFYETAGYIFDKKESGGLSDTYLFRKDGEAVVVTFTLPLDNESDRLMVSTTRVTLR